MHLERASWFPQAERLRDGQRRRVDHDCGSGRTLLIRRDHDGYHAWCFRCCLPGFVGPQAESLEDKLARINRMLVGDGTVRGVVGDLPLPRVYEVSEWPDGAAVWLYKAGLGRNDIGRLGIFYHPPSDRVVLPVPGRQGSVFFQARAYQTGRFPKYLGPDQRPRDLVPVWGRARSATLCEDILSAMKVGMVGEGWAVLGTSVSDAMVAALLKRGTPVNVALDPDPAGRKGAAKICKQLRAYGLNVRDVVMPRDPKLMPLDYLRRVLVEGEDPTDV